MSVTQQQRLTPGEAIVAASADWQAKHFVYASVSKDDTVMSKPDSKDSKRAIERAIKASPMGWTMLHDTDFMDNWLPTQRWALKAYRTILLRRTFYKHPERKIAMISTRDIGRAGALAFAKPDEFMNSVMPLAGDLLDMEEVQKIYKEVMGEPIAETWGIVAGLVKWAEPSVAQLSQVSNAGVLC